MTMRQHIVTIAHYRNCNLIGNMSDLDQVFRCRYATRKTQGKSHHQVIVLHPSLEGIDALPYAVCVVGRSDGDND